MRWRRRRGLGFFPGLVLGTVLGVGAIAMFGAELDDQARKLQEEGLRWRARAIEFTSRTGTQVDSFIIQTESELWAQISSLTGGIIQDDDNSAHN